MYLSGAFYHILLYAIFIYGASIFLYGFFPLSHKNANNKPSTYDGLPEVLDDIL